MGTVIFLSLIMSGDNDDSNYRNISSIIYSGVLHKNYADKPVFLIMKMIN